MFDFLSGIGDFLDGAAAAIGQAVAFLFSAMLYLFNLLLSLLSAVVQAIGAILGKIGALLKHLWENFFKGILQSLWQHIRDAVSWLHDHIAKVIDFLHRVHDRLQRYYNMFVLPYLRMIQRIRQWLHILALLHVKIAAELDAKLAAMQQQIVQAFAVVNAAINVAIDLGNAVLDPTYLLRKPALLLSIRRQIPALIHGLTGRPAGYWFPSPRGASGGAFSPAAGSPLFSGGAWSILPSSLLGDDAGVGDVTGFAAGLQLQPGAIDQQAPLDYFNDDLYAIPTCNDPAQCLSAAQAATPPLVSNG